MKTVTALILEKGDFTRDSHLKFDAFEAMCLAGVVIHGSTIVKNRETGEIGAILSVAASGRKEPIKRAHRARVPQPTPEPPQAPPAPADELPPFHEYEH